MATLLSALLVPLKNWLVAHRWPKWLAITVAELGTLVIVAALIFLVVAQVRAGFGYLSSGPHDLAKKAAPAADI